MVSSVSYLVFAHTPDDDELVPRPSGPEITTQLLTLGFYWMHDGTYYDSITTRPNGFFFVEDDSLAGHSNDDAPLVKTNKDETTNETTAALLTSLSSILGGRQRLVASDRSMSFM